MGTDIIIQIGLILLTVAIFIFMHDFPKKALSNLRSKRQTTAQSHRHFFNGANLLSKARSTPNRTTSLKLAKSAAAEADLALLLDPRDAAAHILKALALDLMGHKASALRSLDAALSPPAVKSLAEKERGDALFKRAELQVGVNKKRRVDSAVADLVEAVRLSEDNGKAWCLLGRCYEMKGMEVEARKAFQEAIGVEPGLVPAREGLDRLGS